MDVDSPWYADQSLLTMMMHRSPTKALILLSLLALQMQLLASWTLPCEHPGAAFSGEDNACPYHLVDDATPRAADAASRVLDCQKCVLALIFGTYHPLSFVPSLGLPTPSPIKSGSGFKHFYRFVPDRLYRPPILLPA
jgi:hypothetical protein